ncbi:MAG: S9 family peptidase [Pseudomonadota bacterium]
MFKQAAKPAPERRPKRHYRHGQRRSDPYGWLAERDSPDVLAHLQAENDYTAAVMVDAESVRDELFTAIRSRMADEKTSAPVYDRGYWYWYRYDAGSEYATHWRGRTADTASGELLLDGPQRASGHAFFAIGDIDIATNERWLAYTVDTQGRRLYSLRVVDLTTGTEIDTGIAGLAAGIAWANDNKTLFVVAKDPDTLREYRVLRLTWDGRAITNNGAVYTENDETFFCTLGRTARRHYVTVTSHATLTSEYRLIDGDQPDSEPQLFLARDNGHELTLDYDGDEFWLLTNDAAPNGRLCRTANIGEPPGTWTEVVAHSNAAQLTGFELFNGYVAIELTERAQSAIDILDMSGHTRRRVDFGGALHSVELDDNPEYDSASVRVRYESMAEPATLKVVSFDDLSQRDIYVEPVNGDFSAASYATERRWVATDDGAEVPVSLLYRKDQPIEHSTNVLVYGYGAYGYSIDPTFSLGWLALVDRGFVVAIAHVRGGSELGQRWYDGGRLKRKHASFDDFNAVAADLAGLGGGEPNRLFAMGGSAGGLLVGAAMNLQPALYHAVVAEVPFVDVVTTMLDDSIPLTTFEYQEWGDPREAADYHTMMAYSPYDNVARTAYPHILATAGLHDSQVQYWEPAKWVARLRERQQGAGVILLKTEMDAGHGGQSGRYQRLHESCFVYAFLLLAAETPR